MFEYVFLLFSWFKKLTFFQLFSHSFECFFQSSLQTFCSWKNSRFSNYFRGRHKNLFLITVCNFFVVEKTHVFSYLKYPPDVRICFSIVLVVQKTHVFPTIFSFLPVFFSRLSLNPVCKLFVVGKTHVFSTKKNLSDFRGGKYLRFFKHFASCVFMKRLCLKKLTFS